VGSHELGQQIGCQVTGIDPAIEHVHDAQAAAEAAAMGERVRFIAGNAIEADFPAGAFDAIVSQDAFVTIEDKARLFACCQRWLRPSDRLAATLIVDLGGLQGQADRLDLLAWPIPTVDDCRICVEQASLRILAIDDLSRSFREIGARWRGALMVWESALVSALGYDIVIGNWFVHFGFDAWRCGVAATGQRGHFSFRSV
jgi:SAM-dependent methyltransferase